MEPAGDQQIRNRVRSQKQGSTKKYSWLPQTTLTPSDQNDTHPEPSPSEKETGSEEREELIKNTMSPTMGRTARSRSMDSESEADCVMSELEQENEHIKQPPLKKGRITESKLKISRAKEVRKTLPTIHGPGFWAVAGDIKADIGKDNLKKPWADKENESSLFRSKESSQASGQAALLLQEVYNDLCKIPEGLYSLLRPSYSFLKWSFLLYILWITASHAWVACMNHISQSVQPYCGKTIIGSMIPFCPGLGRTPDGTAANFMNGISSQEELGRVMESVGQNHELARAMSRHEWVLRDLRIRTAASKSRHTEELVRELDLLIQYTEDAAWAISSFTAKVVKATDVIIAIDEDAVKKLEAIEDRQNQLPSLQQAALNMLSPFSAFRSTGNALTEKNLKEVFLTATSRIADRLPPCIADAWELHGLFKKIQSTLDQIQELALDEMGDLPQTAILASWWNQFARPDEHSENRSHKELLEDLTRSYRSLGERTVDTISALMKIKSELKEFRDEYASAKLVWREFPLKVIMSAIRKSTERLELGRRTLERIEEGERRVSFQSSRSATYKEVV